MRVRLSKIPEHLRAAMRGTARVGGGRRRGGVTANKAGRHFEQVIAASASGASPVRLQGLPKCGGRFISQGNMVNEDMPCDFVGCFVTSGRALFFDAKSCEEGRTGLRVRDPKIVKPHQVAFLSRMAESGAESGFLVESKRAKAYLWFNAKRLVGRDVIQWDDPAWVFLGGLDGLVRFDLLVGVK